MDDSSSPYIETVGNTKSTDGSMVVGYVFDGTVRNVVVVVVILILLYLYSKGDATSDSHYSRLRSGYNTSISSVKNQYAASKVPGITC
jgi:hypothetical protein